jgi:hypothetical protein
MESLLLFKRHHTDRVSDQQSLTATAPRAKQWVHRSSNLKSDVAPTRLVEIFHEDFILKLLATAEPSDINAIGSAGRTVLHIAHYRGFYQLQSTLVSNYHAEADPTIEDSKGRIPSYYDNKPESEWHPPVWAVKVSKPVAHKTQEQKELELLKRIHDNEHTYSVSFSIGRVDGESEDH